MRFHRNARLGLAGRHALVHAIAGGCSIREAAATFNVSAATAHRWCIAGISERERAYEPFLSSRSIESSYAQSARLAPKLEEAICACRRQTGWGPRLVSGATGFAHSTVWKVLKRAGLSRPPRAIREPANSSEWPCPGDLLHMDVSEYVRFKRPGHRMTGDQRSHDRVPDGVDHVHAVVDDHSRLACAEIHADARAETAAAFCERALAFSAAHGIRARRLMTDNAWAYARSRVFRELLVRHGIAHLKTKPYRPRTNGKVERFHQTMAREWAYGLV